MGFLLSEGVIGLRREPGMVMFAIFVPPTVIALLIYLLAWVVAGLHPRR
jgi:hypothetical protein